MTWRDLHLKDARSLLRRSKPANTKSLVGQMVTGSDTPMPVTFCFIVNWGGDISSEEFDEVEAEFFAAIEGVLGAVK